MFLIRRLLLGMLLFFVSVCNDRLLAGCVVEYLMEESSATVVGDTSGNVNNAYFVGQPIWQAGHSVSSQYCLNFDGNAYFEAPDSVSLDSISSGFTITAWIKADQDSTRDTIVWKLGAFRVWKNNSNIVVSLEGVSTVQNYIIITGLIPNGVWLHVAVMYDGQYLAGYVDGIRKRRVRVNSINVPISTSNYPLRVGWYGSVPHYRGLLDNVRLYNNALSDADVIADRDNDIKPTLPLTIVQSGLAATAIVIPTGTALEVETLAANELQYHIKQATGITLGIYEENNKPITFSGLIYVGACNATATAGINGNYLEDNAYVVRNVGSNLFFAGHDSSGNPLGMLHINDTRIGTMLAVYRFLEQYMQVKWLWPGSSGEVIPSTTDLVAGNIAIIDKPVIEHTRLNDSVEWDWGFPSGTHDGWTTAEVRDDYLNAQSLWMRRHGFCRSITTVEYSHAFGTWWDTYHLAHPDYFNKLPDGTRRPDPYYDGGGRTELISMCMSDPNLHKQIVDNWVAAGRPECINCSENDTPTKCTCSRCMSWDVEPANFQSEYGYPWSQRLTCATNAFNAGQENWYTYLGPMGTRLAKFLLAVQQEAQSRGYTGAKVIAYSYVNYANKPLGVQLNDRVIIGVVPNISFPWTDEKKQYFHDLWSGWADSGAQVYLRPNYFLDGHDFPINFACRFGSDFLYALRRGLFATNFYALTGQWSTQGLNLYMLARVQTHVGAGWENWGTDVTGDGTVDISDLAVLSNYWLDDASGCEPGNRCGDINGDGKVDFRDFVQLAGQWHDNNAEVKLIMDEFYDAFGPAKAAVRAYFDYWESVSDSATKSPPWPNWFIGADEIFTPNVMATGRTLITNAQAAAVGDLMAVRLVDFLEKGFTNVEKTLAAQAAWENYYNYGYPYFGSWQAAFSDLSNYRASVEAEFICNMSWLNWAEKRVWPIEKRDRIAVTCGTLDSFTGDLDYAWNVQLSPKWFRIGNGSTEYDTRANVLLDLGSVKNVTEVIFKNAPVTTGEQIRYVDVYAADETAPGFDPLDESKYTMCLYGGYVSGYTYDANSQTTADIIDVSKRYLRIGIRDHANGWTLNAAHWYAELGDINIISE